jgi:hypothetical protein
MRKNNWEENKVVKRIYELRKEYEFRHMFAGCSMGFATPKIEDLWECDCCGTLMSSSESLYHKTEQGKGISICRNCSELWRVVPCAVAEQTGA